MQSQLKVFGQLHVAAEFTADYTQKSQMESLVEYQTRKDWAKDATLQIWYAA